MGALAFFLLGIERFLYGYIYHFPDSFKRLCHGALKSVFVKDEGLYWKVAKDLGVVVKIFQFGVIGYDLFIRRTIGVGPMPLLALGAALVGAGQLLNGAVFNAIGGVGVYYGNQLGYEVPWCTGFPYNLKISDPQYWGVVLCIVGVYLMCSPGYVAEVSHYVVPCLEVFWYIMS